MSQEERQHVVKLLNKMIWVILGVGLSLSLSLFVIGLLQKPNRVDFAIFVGVLLSLCVCLVVFLYERFARKPNVKAAFWMSIAFFSGMMVYFVLFILDFGLLLAAFAGLMGVLTGVAIRLLEPIGRKLEKMIREQNEEKRQGG